MVTGTEMSTALKRMTWEQYLSFERESETKHEFFDGEVFAMAGASRSHNVIIMNVGGQLWNALRGLFERHARPLR